MTDEITSHPDCVGNNSDCDAVSPGRDFIAFAGCCSSAKFESSEFS